MKRENEHIQKQRVELDGQEFLKCRFEECQMVYSGGPLPVLEGCVFHACRFGFEGAADRTIHMMKGLYHGLGEGGRTLINKTFEKIRANV